MADGSQGVVLLVAIICAVAVILISIDAGSEMLRRRTWSRQALVETQPACLLELRTCRAVIGRLADACRRDGCEMPPVMRMTLDEQRVQVFLAAPALHAPGPWMASQDGARWSTMLDVLDGPGRFLSGDSEVPELFVSVGRAGGAGVFVNLAVCPGLVGLEGPERMRHLLIRRWMRELTEPAWRRDVAVLVTGEPGLVGGRACDATDSLRADSAQDHPGGMVVVGGPGRAEEVEAVLQRAHADDHRRAGGVIDGRTGRASWTFRVHDDGSVEPVSFPTPDWRPVREPRAGRLRAPAIGAAA